METVKYLCEFFFNDFWHFVMLLLVCVAISPKISNNANNQADFLAGKDNED